MPLSALVPMCVKPLGPNSDTHFVPSEPSRCLDLVSEMHAAVQEEASLYELPLGVVDRLGEGRTVVHGPWSPEECRSTLFPWLKAGWIELIADTNPPSSLTSAAWRGRASRQGAFLVLSADDAATLLNDPQRWILGTADGHVMLSASCRGQAHEYSAWLELAQRTAASS
jgi:hypothetical protein